MVAQFRLLEYVNVPVLRLVDLATIEHLRSLQVPVHSPSEATTPVEQKEAEDEEDRKAFQQIVARGRLEVIQINYLLIFFLSYRRLKNARNL
jgi:hypothetical protein